MNSNEYQQLAARTLIDKPTEPIALHEIEMLTTMLRLHSLVGTLTEKIKKRVLHRHEDYSHDEYLADLERLKTSLNVELDSGSTHRLYPVPSHPDLLVLWNVIGLLGESSELAQLLLSYGLESLRDLPTSSDARDEWREAEDLLSVVEEGME